MIPSRHHPSDIPGRVGGDMNTVIVTIHSVNTVRPLLILAVPARELSPEHSQHDAHPKTQASRDARLVKYRRWDSNPHGGLTPADFEQGYLIHKSF